MKKLLALLISFNTLLMAEAQKEIPLYDAAIPNSKPGPDQEKRENNGVPLASLVSRPTLTIYPAPKEKANGTAVIICPGGGYSHLAIGHEGAEVAEKLNAAGVTAFVLKYRMPSDQTMIDKTIGPLQDAQRAIQIVRQNAAAYSVNPSRIGIMGFSAGGHLASTAGTHYKTALIDNKSGISLRPDFMILIYPVISCSDAIGHRGSRDNLLGPKADSSLVNEYSNELQVNNDTPPTFLEHSGDDKTVPVANSIRFYEALQQHGVPAELHVYPGGGHGYGLHNRTTKDEWFERLNNWLNGLFTTK